MGRTSKHFYWGFQRGLSEKTPLNVLRDTPQAGLD